MHEDKGKPAPFEKQFARWKLTQVARSLPTARQVDGEAAATRRQTLLMVVVSLAAVAGMIVLIAAVLQNV